MTSTVDIDELRAELNVLSDGLVQKILDEITRLSGAAEVANCAEETHPGVADLASRLSDTAHGCMDLIPDAHLLQSLARDILNAEDARHQQVAS